MSSTDDATPTGVLSRDAVRLGCTAPDKAAAVSQCGELLVAIGAVSSDYVPSMLERERTISTYLAAGVAIPHGTDAARESVNRAALAVLQFPEGVSWGPGQEVRVCVAIASRSDEHVAALNRLAEVLGDPQAAARLRESDDPDEIVALLTPHNDEEDADF